MELLDDTVLQCIFKPRYITFEMTMEMESVSKKFLINARQCQLILSTFSFEPYSNFMKHSRILDKLVRRCPNLKVIRYFGGTIANHDHKFPTKNYCPLMNLNKLTCLEFGFVNLCEQTMIHFSKIRNLQLDRTNCHNDYIFRYGLNMTEETEHTLLHLNQLKIQSCELDFKKICRPEDLTELDMKFDSFQSPIESFPDDLIRCKKLKKLDIFFSVDCLESSDKVFEWMNGLFDSLKCLPRMQKCTLKLKCEQSFLFELVDHPHLCQMVDELHLNIFNDLDQEDLIVLTILKLTQLKHLVIDTALNNFEELFDDLPFFQSYKTSILAHYKDFRSCSWLALHYQKSNDGSAPELTIELPFKAGSRVSSAKLVQNGQNLDYFLLQHGCSVKTLEFRNFGKAKDTATLLNRLAKYCYKARHVKIFQGFSKKVGLILGVQFQCATLEIYVADNFTEKEIVQALEPLVKRNTYLQKVTLYSKRPRFWSEVLKNMNQWPKTISIDSVPLKLTSG